MTKQGIIRHLFPGGNTTQGFFSYFDNILKQEDANHIICIKGGPGVGKSSLMKKIGMLYKELGYDVEYHHCSSDPDSLDGLVIPELKVALLDGTAPHVVDPKNPGAVDEVLNLGEYWQESKLKENKEQILTINKENGRLFNKAYQYLRASGILYEHIEKNAQRAFKNDHVNLDLQYLLDTIFKEKKIVNKNGKLRELFAFGITPKGILDYRKELIPSFENKILIKESTYSSSENLMNIIKNAAIKRGLDVTCMYSPLKNYKIEDIMINSMNTIICIDNKYHPYNFEYNYIMDLDNYVDKDIKEQIQDEVNDDIKEFENLLNKAITYIKKAKDNHDLLEKHYIPYMDFNKHENLLERLVSKINQYK